MKIEDRDLLYGLRHYVNDLKGVERVQREERTRQRVDTGSDRVEISKRSKEAEKARRVIEKVPPVDEKKVADVKRSIEKGSYNVRAQEVAEGIIRKSIIDTIL